MVLCGFFSALAVASSKWSFTCRSFPSQLWPPAAQHLKDKERSILAWVFEIWNCLDIKCTMSAKLSTSILMLCIEKQLQPSTQIKKTKTKSQTQTTKKLKGYGKRPESCFLLEQQKPCLKAKPKSLHHDFGRWCTVLWNNNERSVSLSTQSSWGTIKRVNWTFPPECSIYYKWPPF